MADGTTIDTDQDDDAEAKPRKKARKAKAAEAAPAAEADEAAGGAMKKKDLIDRVVAATGAKRRDAGSVIEATLAAMGAALDAGEALTLPPLGRVRVVKRKDIAKGGASLTLKLARGGDKAAKGDGGLAEGEGSD